jgi:hypothetical protein
LIIPQANIAAAQAKAGSFQPTIFEPSTFEPSTFQQCRFSANAIIGSPFIDASSYDLASLRIFSQQRRELQAVALFADHAVLPVNAQVGKAVLYSGLESRCLVTNGDRVSAEQFAAKSGLLSRRF